LLASASQASHLDSFSYEDTADRAARQDARQQEAVRQCEARRTQWHQAQEKKVLIGTGFSSIKEVDSNWSRFGFVPKPSTAVGGSAGPSGAAAGPSQLPDEVVEI